MTKCSYCDSPATRISYYGDEETVVSGGRATIYHCDRCISPCSHPGDPHASFDGEESIGDAMNPDASVEIE